jgi:hypothetical protein
MAGQKKELRSAALFFKIMIGLMRPALWPFGMINPPAYACEPIPEWY